jgi:CheY-like chemotaxis protein
MRILVCDDEPAVCASLKMMLAALGHEAEIAETAEEALAKYRAQPYDLVVTDFWLPGMKGDELASIIKAQDGAMPVIMVSGSLIGQRPAGVDLLLLKPFTVGEMRQAIAQLSAPGPEPQASQSS